MQNTIINTLPARDAEEHDAFPQAELDFITQWLGWADRNRLLLARQHPLPVAPGHAKVDGSVAFLGDHGVVFLFNPNGRPTASPNIAFNASLGAQCDEVSMQPLRVSPCVVVYCLCGIHNFRVAGAVGL